MSLTPEQYAILNADIEADPILSAYPKTADGAWAIALEYNKELSPAFYVWQTAVRPADIKYADGYDWTRIDNLTVGKARIWQDMTSLEAVRASAPNARAGIEATFSNEGADQGIRQSIYMTCQRPATRFEKLFATGPGTSSTHHGVGPATMGVEGPLAYQDVEEARRIEE